MFFPLNTKRIVFLWFMAVFCQIPGSLFAQMEGKTHYLTYRNNPVLIAIPNATGIYDDNSLSVTIIDHPLHGSLSEINEHGIFTYIPQTDYCGRDSLRYEIQNDGTSRRCWIYILITEPVDNIYHKECYVEPGIVPWNIRRSDSTLFSDKLSPQSQLLVGDIDADGENEIVVVGSSFPGYPGNYTHVVIFNHLLEEEYSFSTDARIDLHTTIAIADVDRDGLAEIVVHTVDGKLTCYNYNGREINRKWENSRANIGNKYVCPAIGDINADGIPEILLDNRIYNAQTGELLLILPESIGNGEVFNQVATPLLADMDQDLILEVVGGNQIIKIEINNNHGTARNRGYVWKKIEGVELEDGFTSVADIDQDGFPDVVVTTLDHLYIWSPCKGPRSSPEILAHARFTDGPNWTSRAVVSDVDRDGNMEIIWAFNQGIRCYKYRHITGVLEVMWEIATMDISGASGISAFDFNNDRKVELAYRDHTHLRIINGTTGENIASMEGNSGTGLEYPVIVDLDKDQTAEIVVLEGDENLSGRIAVYENSGEPWAAARSVWNQYGYNGVHVKENLTVPQYQFNPSTPFGAATPFNHFLQQTGPVNHLGETFVAACDIHLKEDSIIVERTCDSIDIFFTLLTTGPVQDIIDYTVYAVGTSPVVVSTDTLYGDFTGQRRHEITLTFTKEELEIHEPFDSLILCLNDSGNGIGIHTDQEKECDKENNTYFLSNYPPLFNKYSIMDITICEGEAIGQDIPGLPDTVFPPGKYRFYEIYPSTQECDSFVEINLTVHPAYHREIVIDTCGSYTYEGIKYTESGTYEHRYLSASGCDSVEFLHLNIGDANVRIENTTPDFCTGFKSILVAHTNSENIRWSTGETTPSIEVFEPGDYSVTVTDQHCLSEASTNVEMCDHMFYIANAITPSVADGLNDEFSVPWISEKQVREFEIFIYTRTGNTIYHSKDPFFSWDGKINETVFPNTVYQYIIYFRLPEGKKQTLTGSITVL